MNKYTYTVSVSSETGQIRDNNEDNFSVNGKYRKPDQVTVHLRGSKKGPIFSAVFDGMGGEKDGEIASEIAAKNTRELFKKLSMLNDQDFDEAIYQYVLLTNKEICDTIGNTEVKRSGTTMAILYISNDIAYSYFLGDSRIYLYRNNKLFQLSKDHTLAMKKLDLNIYSEEEAKNSPDSHKLIKFLGYDLDNEKIRQSQTKPVVIQEGDVFLLCTDGLYDMLDNDSIIKVINGNSGKVSIDLTDKANSRGGNDNITVITIETKQEGIYE